MREIPLTQGFVALVDDEDYDLVSQFNWYVLKPGSKRYAVRHLGIKTQYMHAVVSGFLMTDHRNGDSLDNQRSNLREATKSQNGMNRGKPVTNTSGFKGVSWDKRKRKWESYISVNGKRRHLGYSTDIIEAALAYDRAARKLHGEFAWLNFPEVTDYSQLPTVTRGPQPNNTSGYKGVYWCKQKSKWVAGINVKGKHIYLGQSNDPIKAALLYDRAVREYHGEFVWLNFPEIMDYSQLPSKRKR